MMAPKSSITASAVKNTFREAGILFPRSDKIPTAKAMSVAIGIPAPAWRSVPKLNKRKIPAGKSIPPNAPTMGKVAFLMFESSP